MLKIIIANSVILNYNPFKFLSISHYARAGTISDFGNEILCLLLPGEDDTLSFFLVFHVLLQNPPKGRISCATLAYVMTSRQIVSCKLDGHDIRTTHCGCRKCPRVDGRMSRRMLVAYDSTV